VLALRCLVEWWDLRAPGRGVLALFPWFLSRNPQARLIKYKILKRKQNSASTQFCWLSASNAGHHESGNAKGPLHGYCGGLNPILRGRGGLQSQLARHLSHGHSCLQNYVANVVRECTSGAACTLPSGTSDVHGCLQPPCIRNSCATAFSAAFHSKKAHQTHRGW
jgi:hypothetical protein